MIARLVVLVSLLAGCFSDPGGGEEAGSSGAGGSSSGAGGESGATGAGTPTSGGKSATTTGETGAEAGTTAAAETATVCADPPGQPQDAACTDESGCGCASGRCFVIPVAGGWCGECLVDGDCAGGGCTLPNPGKMLGAVCNDGGAGAGCMSDAACNDPKYPNCATIYELPEILTVRTCSQCVAAADCAEFEPYCMPEYTAGIFGGSRLCVGAGSRPNDSGCDVGADGDAACASGHCTTASLMGLLELGVCGACAADADCPMGQTCMAAAIDFGTGAVIGARCV